MPLAETHIMNFNDNLYGETVTILLIDFIRQNVNSEALRIIRTN